MKLRKKDDDKRVLKSPRNSNARNNKRIRRRNSNPSRSNQVFRRNNPRNNDRIRRRNSYKAPKKQNKTSKTTLLIMIIALVAFVVGAGVGVSMALGIGNDDTPHYENVTVEMTTHLNNTHAVDYDEEADDIDFNNKEDISHYNLTNVTTNVSY